MNYTNGFDLDVVLPALSSRVGWRSENVARPFEAFDPVCEKAIIKEIQPTPNIDNTAFDAYLATLKSDVITSCLQKVFQETPINKTVLLHNRIPYQQRQVLPTGTDFRGLRIKIPADNSLSTFVKRITLFFDSAATFNIYVYQDGYADPIYTKSVTSIANKPTVISFSDVLLSYYLTQSTVFFIGYKQSELSGAKAIREQVEWNCGICGATSFTMPESKIADFLPAETFDSYGINAELTTFSDYTYLITDSASLFDDVIGNEMVLTVGDKILKTTRSNATERTLSDTQKLELQYRLFGSVPAMGVSKTEGLDKKQEEKFDELREVFYPCPKVQTVSIC